MTADDYLGVVRIGDGQIGDRETAMLVDASSNVILNEEGVTAFRLVALADIGSCIA